MKVLIRRWFITGLCLAVCLTGCTKYTTNRGRRGLEQAPVATHPIAQQAPQVILEHAELDSVPDLVTPIIKSVWIMPHQTTSGDFVGAYVLHMVIRPGGVVPQSEAIVTRPPLPKTEVAPPLIPPPQTQHERRQYELPEEDWEEAPYRGKPRERSMYPVEPQSGPPSQKTPNEILVEQGKKAAEQLRQMLPGATPGEETPPPPPPGAIPQVPPPGAGE
jgi:hypothetical protein